MGHVCRREHALTDEVFVRQPGYLFDYHAQEGIAGLVVGSLGTDGMHRQLAQFIKHFLTITGNRRDVDVIDHDVGNARGM